MTDLTIPTCERDGSSNWFVQSSRVVQSHFSTSDPDGPFMNEEVDEDEEQASEFYCADCNGEAPTETSHALSRLFWAARDATARASAA